ncbi:hypothetical protein [Pseudomonas sp. S2_B10]
MFRLNRLEEQYQEALSADVREWDMLIDTVRLIGSGFANYLAASEDSNAMSNTRPKVIFGPESEDHSIDADLSKLLRTGRDVRFTIRLDLTEVPTEAPPSFFIFRLQVQPQEKGVAITDTDSGESIPLERGFVSVFEHLYGLIQKRLGVS